MGVPAEIDTFTKFLHNQHTFGRFLRFYGGVRETLPISSAVVILFRLPTLI
jgi:hypothetical protein